MLSLILHLPELGGPKAVESRDGSLLLRATGLPLLSAFNPVILPPCPVTAPLLLCTGPCPRPRGKDSSSAPAPSHRIAQPMPAGAAPSNYALERCSVLGLGQQQWA